MALNRRRCFSSALNCSVPVAPRGYLVPMLHHTMNGHFGGGVLQLFHTKNFSILPKRNLNRKLSILSDILDYYQLNYLTKLYGFFPPNVLLFFLTEMFVILSHRNVCYFISQKCLLFYLTEMFVIFHPKKLAISLW